MSTFNASAYMKKRYSQEKDKGKDEEDNKISSSKIATDDRFDASAYMKKKYVQTQAISEFGLDTLQSDLTTTAKTIDSVYNGWQTPETMNNTRLSVQNMYDRIGKYQEYQKKYGGADLSELHNSYKSILDEWDSLSTSYGKYKNADAYNKENSMLKELGTMTSSDVEGKITEIKDLEGILKTAKEHENKVKGLRNRGNTWGHRGRGLNTDGGYEDKLKSAESEYNEFLKSVGFKSTKDIENALSGKSLAYTTVGGENITWQSLYDSKKQKEESDALYKEISSRDDFEKYKSEGANIENPTYEGATKGPNFFGRKPFAEDVENTVEFAFDNKDKITLSNMYGSFGDDNVYYTTMTNQERELHNYYLGQERAGLVKEGTADEYLKSIEGMLKDRHENQLISKLVDYTEEHPILGSTISVWQNLGAGVEHLGNSVKYLKTGEMDKNNLSKASSAIRSTVSQKVDWEIGNWDAFDFVYNSGMSMADSVVSMASFGNMGGVALGLSAAAQGTNDALERGLDSKSAFWSGLSAGVFEGLFETYSIGKFKALKDAPVDGVKSIIKNVGKSMLTNASEETLTEIANLTYDYFANGDLSQAETKIRAYINSGMSEKEATRKVAIEQAGQVAEAGASGALMGLGFGGVGGASAYNKSKGIGQNIKANERVGDLFDIASNPEVASAYEAYTEYANKGINADNISDAKLGRLYSSAKADAVDTLTSKKTTSEQKTEALKTLAKLSVVETENTIKKAAKEFNVGEETKVTESGDAVDIKDVRIKGDTVTVATEKGDISVEDITLTQNDAEIIAFAKEISKTDGEDVANLFLNQYDGKAEVEEYANSFNLTMAYARNNFTYETILNKKGVLSTEQVKSIYQETRIKADKERQDAIKKLNKKMADKKFYKGYIDDSVIDYENTSAAGKVNWSDLNTRQRQAVTFIKGFAQATGMNLVLEHNPDSKYGGKYEVRGNTITIDIANYYDRVGNLKETIIPTMSHETTHWMKEKSPELWRNLNEIVFSTLTEHYNSNTEQAIKDKIELLDRLEPRKKHTEEDAKERIISEADLIQAEMNRKGNSEEISREEIIARACEDMLKMSEQGRKIFNSLSESEQKTLVGKIKSLINDLLNWVNDLLNSYESTSTEARIMREYKEELQKASKVWDEMLKKSVVANQSLEKSGAFKNETSAEGDVKYSDRPFAEQVDAVLSGEDAISTHLKISEHTPKILLDLGLSDKPLLITSVHTKSAVGYKVKGKNIHYVDKDVLKSLPKLVENPAMVMESTKQGSIVMFVNAVDVNKNPVLCSIKINGTGFYNNVELESNVVTSVYGKDTNPVGFVEKAVDENRLLYWDKKMSQKLFDIPGLQLPDNIYNLDSNTIIRKIGKNVNTNFSDKDSTGRELSKGQQDYFKDSTVRDESGNLKVMYRGDKGDFTVFDRKKTNYSNLYGRGFYFTESKAHAEQYGNAREFYLDIKNPLSPKQNVITKKQMLNFLKAIENDGEDYDLYNYGEGATAESVLNSVWGKGDFEMLQDISASAIGDLVATVELFNEINGTTYDGIVLPTETVTFNSEQAKLTSNLNPTKDKDILFSMRDNVEETRDLVAVHNMQVSELERTLDLGGLPMPSIAIIKAQSGHSEYGDVSLVFPKSTIDPKADKNNKVYGGDAWTPTYPTIEYKPNPKVTQKINDKYYELSRKFGYDESRPMYRYVYEMEEQLNRHKGEAELLEELYDDEKMMQVYLLDTGKNKIETIQKETRTELTDAEVEMNEFFIKELGADVVDEVMWDGNGTPMSYRKNYLSKYGNSIREAYKKLLSEVYQFTDEQVQNVLDSAKTADYLRFMRDAHKYRENGRVTTKTEDDYEATKTAIKDASGDGYRGWIDSLFKGIEEKSGIRNNVDYFTNSGNRRSWEALHWENNLENVVKVMKSQDNGVAALFSGHAIWAVSAKDYRSVDEMKADSDRLKRLSEEEYNEIKEGFGTRFQEIAESIMSKTESNPFIASDNAMSCIVEAVRNSKTKSGILKNLKEYPQLTVTETTVEDIISLVADISNMPTEYFEAKPKRAVELNEIATAIIPDNTSDSTKKRLDDMGIKYLEYESGNEESRLDALNSLEDVRFSDRDTSYMEAVESEEKGKDALSSDRDDTSVYDLMGETERIKKENEKFKAEVERLKERLKIERKVTKGNFFNENQLGAAAGHLRNISRSTIDKAQLVESLKDVYSFIAHSPEITWEEVFEKCYNVADAMLEMAKPETVTDDYSKHILREIRESRISLSREQKKEAEYIFGKNWNRYFFNRVVISDKGIPIDSKWQEWSDMYPDIFEAGISDGDMIGELYDIINTLKDASEAVVKYDAEEQKRWLAREIYNQYWNVSPIRTTADKYDKQIRLLNFEHRRIMTEFREEYNSRIKKQKIADDIHYGKIIKEIRERKDKQIALAKEHGRDMLNKHKENAERKTRIQSITANALTLNKWLTKNSKDYHIHEAMKGPVVKLLNAIDFSSKRMLEKGEPTQKDTSFAEAFAEVNSMLKDADNMVEGLESLYGHDLAADIEKLAKSTYNLVGDNNYIINAMSLEELQSLDKLVRHIKKVVTELNKFHVVNHNQGAVNLGDEFMEHGEKLGNLKKQHGKMGKYFEFRNRTPYYFFKDLGKVGEKLFKAFQDGWDKLAFNAKKVIDFAKETYTAKEVKEWTKETKQFKIPQFDGTERTFEMSIAQIMALHCVSKQKDAQNHLLSGGMTLKRIDKKGHVVTDYDNITLTLSDLQTILSSLTDRQKEVADKLQNFMNTVCSDWGNEISMARFGIEMFGIPDYFPIKVSEATVPTDNTKDIDNASLFRLLNMSFTKARNQNAKQSIEIGDIFDIFAQHSSDMAKYNALALPVLDFNKFYSIQGRDLAGKEYGVVKTLKSVFGDEANGYLRRFVRDLNGSQNVSRDVIGNTFFKNAKVASVAANLRVVLLQPTAFFKASAVMDNKYLLKASAYVKVEPVGMVKKLKKAIADAEKYCGIVQWKSLGYYDTDISKGLTEKIKHADGFKDKAIEKSLKLAEIADKVTFGTLWIASEFEIRDTRKDLKVGSEEFYNAIANRLRDVIYATQVVDSTMTRSDMMRSSDGRDKMLTAFGSEPTIAYNMLLDMATQYNRDKKEFGNKEARKMNSKKIRKVVTAYVITNAVAALVESGFDALRDDDDEEMDAAEFMKLYLKNFAFDMSVGNKLPYVKEAYSLLQGYSSSRMDTQWLQSINYAMKDIKKLSEGEGSWMKTIKDTIKAMSYLSGLPFYNVYRDAMALLEKLGILDEE